MIVQPPVGVAVAAPPPECSRIEVEGTAYCYHYGSFYLFDEGKQEYRVVQAPVGAVVTYLPDKHTVEHVEGVKYHVYNGVYYQPVYRGSQMVYWVARDLGGA